MWYVVQVFTGKEEYCRELLERYVVKKVIADCKIPKYVSLRKYNGIWTEERKILFPGYLFVKSDDKEKLYMELKKVPKMTRLLGVGEEIIPISEEEQRFLFHMGKDDLVIKMSRGAFRDGKVVVEAGPLQGLEEYIRKIDRHKRLAWLTLPLFGKQVNMCVGMEVIGCKTQ